MDEQGKGYFNDFMNAPVDVEGKRDRSVEWQKHVISYDEGIDAGLAIWAGDFRGTGACDIIVTGKFGGPVWFENKGK